MRTVLFGLLSSTLVSMAFASTNESVVVTVMEASNNVLSVATDDCYRIPGLVLEMGSDLPLDNFSICLEPLSAEHRISRVSLPRAHHYLNQRHWLVSGELICDAGSTSRRLTLSRLATAALSPAPMFIEVFSQCGADGCDYELTFITEGDVSWCDKALNAKVINESIH